MSQRIDPSGHSMIESALQYARRGYKVFPVYSAKAPGVCACPKGKSCTSPAKHPMTANGFRDATTDEERIRQFWRRVPEANIGLVTGPGFGAVVDIDPRNGGDETLERLEAEFGALPATLTAKTGGDGKHFVFLCPEDFKGKTGALPGIDLKSAGGYIVAPPSLHASGKRYSWETGRGPGEIPMASIPEDLLAKLSAKTAKTGDPSPSGKFKEGTRNDSLFQLAIQLSRAGLSSASLIEALKSENRNRCEPPLPEDEVGRTALNAAAYSNKKAWMPPEALPVLDPPAPSLPEELLPEGLLPWVKDVSERMQVPLEYIAIPAITCLASAIGRRAEVYPKRYDNWSEIPNLWGLLVAPPGTLKTPSLSEALGFLRKIQQEEHEKFAADERKYALDEAAEKKKILALVAASDDAEDEKEANSLRAEIISRQASIEGQRPVRKRLVVNDATFEVLQVLLSQNPYGILCFRDEMFGLLAALEKKGREGERQFYLESWSGKGSYTCDRITRETTFVPNLCVGLLGGIQMDRLQQFFGKTILQNSADDGMLARFQLMVCPTIKKEYVHTDRPADSDASKRVEEIFRKVLGLAEVTKGKKGDPILSCRFSEAAQKHFDSWFTGLETRLRNGSISSPTFLAHLSKFRSLLPSLALIFHLVSHSSRKDKGFDGDLKSISVDSFHLAEKWCDFLEIHARKIYAPAIDPDLFSAHALAEKISDGILRDGTSLREIYRHGWVGLESAEAARGGCLLLQKFHWLEIREVKNANGGPPSEVIYLNPGLKKEAE